MANVNTEHYVFGKPRVPPWVGDSLTDIKYDSDGKLIGASVHTINGVKTLKKGDVLMRINSSTNAVVMLGKEDAKKYGVEK